VTPTHERWNAHAPMYFDGNVHIENEDQCFSCEYIHRSITCPLMEALAMGIVELEGQVYVTNCGFYKKFERHLRIVKNDPDANPPEDASNEGASSQT
jgi:hypothetical protein